MPMFAAESTTTPTRSNRAAFIVICAGACINLLISAVMVCINFAALWGIPPESHFRSAIPVWNLEIPAAGFLLSTIMSVTALIWGWRSVRIRALAILVFLMGFLPLAVAATAYDMIVSLHQLVLD
jgi:hypothetical protein